MDKVRYIRVAPGEPLITISGRADLVDLHIHFIEVLRELAHSLYPKESPLSSDTSKSGSTVCRHMNEPFECVECKNERNGACIE